MVGRLALSAGDGARPAVLIAPEASGLDELFSEVLGPRQSVRRM